MFKKSGTLGSYRCGFKSEYDIYYCVTLGQLIQDCVLLVSLSP